MTRGGSAMSGVVSPVRQAARFVARDPAAWVVSALGFLARGGILLFLALVIEIPSPITVTQIFGVDSITGTGEPTARLVVTIGVGVVVVVVAALAMVGLGAWADAVVFRRVTAASPPRLADAAGLAWLQGLGILPALVAFVAAVPTVRDLVIGELLLPSQPQVPFLARVLRGAEQPLLRVVIFVLAFELLVTVATRVYLGDQTRRSAVGAYLRSFAVIARRPIGAVVAWMVGWTVLLTAVAAGLAAVALAWTGIQSIFLDADALRSLSGLGRALAAGTLFAAVWVGAILLIGLASAFRSALWTYSVGPRPADDRLVAAEFAISQ